MTKGMTIARASGLALLFAIGVAATPSFAQDAAMDDAVKGAGKDTIAVTEAKNCEPTERRFRRFGPFKLRLFKPRKPACVETAEANAIEATGAIAPCERPRAFGRHGPLKIRRAMPKAGVECDAN